MAKTKLFPPIVFLILLMFIKGDIEIIAALGDGLVAGMGALSSDIRDLSTQHRGVSFVTGNTALGMPFTCN
jgi:hypothetical protein